MGSKRPRPVVLDAGALIAVDRADRRILRLLELADEVHVPAGALGQAWRNPVRQVRLVRVVRSEGVRTHPLDADSACAAGQLCAATGTSDVIDASVAIVARAVDGVVVTSDPDGLRRLDPAIELVTC